MTPVSCNLEWHPGPANGGVGTAGEKNGVSQWWDGDILLIIVETNSGREFAVVHISADGDDYFEVRDASTGDDYDAWSPDEWSWWAKLDEKNLPPQPQPTEP